MTSVPVTGIRSWIRRGANRDAPARSLELAYLNDGHCLVAFTERSRRCADAEWSRPAAALPEGAPRGLTIAISYGAYRLWSRPGSGTRAQSVSDAR